jgi:sulfur carrier protein
MNLILNGKSREFPSPSTVADLLKELHISTDTVVVELNHSILEPKSFGEQLLKESDKLEIIRFVGGG